MSVSSKSKRTSTETTRDKILEWNEYYSSQRFGIGVECTSCKKWRLVYEYVEEHEVPENWECSMSVIDGQNGHCDLPSKYTADYFVEEVYVPGSIVWAKCQSYPWWPAMVEDDPDCEEYHVKGEADGDEEYHVVFFYETPTRAWVRASNITCFVKPPSNLKGKKSYKKKLENAKERAAEAVKMPISDRLKSFSFAILSQKKFPRSRTATEVPKIPLSKIALQPNYPVLSNVLVQQKVPAQPTRKRDVKNTANRNLPIKKRKSVGTYGAGNDARKMSRNPNKKPSRALTPDSKSDETVPAALLLPEKPPQSPVMAEGAVDDARQISRHPDRKPSRVLTPDTLDSKSDEMVPASSLLPEKPPQTPVTAEDPSNSPDAQAAMPNPPAVRMWLDVQAAIGTEEIVNKYNETQFEKMLACDSKPPSPYPVPEYLRKNKMDELFSDVHYEDLSSGEEPENESVKKTEERTIETSNEEIEENWIETKEYYRDVLKAEMITSALKEDVEMPTESSTEALAMNIDNESTKKEETVPENASEVESCDFLKNHEFGRISTN